jgi:hypothetical protein
MGERMNNNKWLILSQNLYLFGNGGVSKVEEIDTRLLTKETTYRTALFCTNVKVGVVQESVEEIQRMLLTTGSTYVTLVQGENNE